MIIIFNALKVIIKVIKVTFWLKKLSKVILNNYYTTNAAINKHSSFLNIDFIYILIFKFNKISSVFYLMQYSVFYNEKKIRAKSNIFKINKFNYYKFILKVIKKFIYLQENEEWSKYKTSFKIYIISDCNKKTDSVIINFLKFKN